MKTGCSNKQTIRFRRWSRKGYAMFCSLGKCVTIGCLKKGIADASLGKQANACPTLAACQSAQEANDGREDGEGCSRAGAVLLPEAVLLSLLLIQLPQPQAVDAASLFLNKVYYCHSRKDASCTLSAFFIP